jgi:hypothetical protein
MSDGGVVGRTGIVDEAAPFAAESAALAVPDPIGDGRERLCRQHSIGRSRVVNTNVPRTGRVELD